MLNGLSQKRKNCSKNITLIDYLWNCDIESMFYKAYKVSLLRVIADFNYIIDTIIYVLDIIYIDKCKKEKYKLWHTNNSNSVKSIMFYVFVIN